MKTSELTGRALDWAVAKCEGWKVSVAEFRKSQLSSSKFAYSTVWAKGGPIIERERIGVRPIDNGWVALHVNPHIKPYKGFTPLIAVCRCYVASKLGDEVEIPEELV